MAKKKKKEQEIPVEPAEIEVGSIANVIEVNYMPYAMSVIVARAIPEIDGFKPSHRKLLYTMYKMGLLNGAKTKSANVVGQTMKLNPHGDAAIYETLVRLTTGKESLLHPFIESKGSFGKQYSDMAYAASRYTECKLSKICEQIFGGIDKDAVDFTDNYDRTIKEPLLLPTAFPNILVSPNSGIAVGIASMICSFNLAEICDLTTLIIRKGKISDDELLETLKAPDFPTGGYIYYDRDKMLSVYKTGRGSFRVRSKYAYDASQNCIDVTEIPYTTTSEKIKDAIAKLVKDGKIREISDVRDETDINGMKLTIDLKRGADPDKLMARLLRSTPLEDPFPANFNVLIGGSPKTLGVLDILEEWIAFRTESLRRVFTFDYGKKNDKLHLLYGLKEILLDIDKAIRIIRGTENDKDVIPNLMEGFGIDEIQADYVADIRLRNLNREYILDRIDEIDDLEKEIAHLLELINSDKKIRDVIIKELAEIKATYGKPRKTFLLFEKEDDLPDLTETIEDYPVKVFLSQEGYFKKCTVASLRANDVQKLKENDRLIFTQESTNRAEVLFFTNKAQVYKAKLYDFEDSKASAMGEFVAAKLKFDDGERVVGAYCLTEFSGEFVLFFANGKGVCIPAENYQTKTNRRKLTSAFFAGSPAVGVFYAGTNKEYLLLASNERALLVGEGQIVRKTTRTSSGAAIFTLKKGAELVSAYPYDASQHKLLKESKYRKSSLPSAGTLYEESDPEVLQQSIDE